MSKLSNIEISCDYVGVTSRKDFAGADEWEVTLYYNDREMTIPYFMGSGHGGSEPDVETVVETLFLDGYALDMDFEEFCGEYGYDVDSRSAYKVYEACRESGEKLSYLLGHDYESIKEEIF